MLFDIANIGLSLYCVRVLVKGIKYGYQIFHPYPANKMKNRKPIQLTAIDPDPISCFNLTRRYWYHAFSLSITTLNNRRSLSWPMHTVLSIVIASCSCSVYLSPIPATQAIVVLSGVSSEESELVATSS